MDKLCPLAVFLLFFIPSACFYRFCKKSVLPRWRYALVLLPGSQGAVLAVILSVIQSFPQEGSGARWLFSLLLPVHLLADVLLLRLLGRLEDGYQNRSRKAELEHQLALLDAYYASLLEREQAVRRMRHDINNHLQTIACLLERGDVAAAGAHLDHLDALLAASGKPPEHPAGEVKDHVECADL